MSKEATDDPFIEIPAPGSLQGHLVITHLTPSHCGHVRDGISISMGIGEAGFVVSLAALELALRRARALREAMQFYEMPQFPGRLRDGDIGALREDIARCEGLLAGLPDLGEADMERAGLTRHIEWAHRELQQSRLAEAQR